MSYPTEDEIKAIKAVEKYKMVDKEEQAQPWLKITAVVTGVIFLFFCARSVDWNVSVLSTTTPAASEAVTDTPWPLPTIQPTDPAPAVIAQVTAVPATSLLTAAPIIPPPLPLATHSPAATYTPYPTGTAQATYTPPPTQTPAATLAALVVTRLVPYPVEIEPAPLPIGWLVAAVGLGMTAVIIGLMAVLRRPVSPPPIIVQQPAVTTPTPQLTPLVLRRNEPMTAGAVETPVTVTPVTPVTDTGAMRPTTITVSLDPAVAGGAVDEALMMELCAIWNDLERPSFNQVIKRKWGENGKNTVTLGITRRAIAWGWERGIIQSRQKVMA